MEEQARRGSSWGRVRVFLGVVGVAFAVTLAAVVGNRLSDEALAVLAGAVCGVGAAIPTSLLIVAVSRRREGGARAVSSPPQGSYPPVVVVAPPGGQPWSGDWRSFPSGSSAPSASSPLNGPVTRPGQREFTVVGETATHPEVRRYYGHYS